MIELYEEQKIETENKSSKGNQLKWHLGDYWYKADYTGYEGLSEVIASKILQASSLNANEYVIYSPEKILYKAATMRGCKSTNFLKSGQQLVTLERLYKNFTGLSLYSTIYKIRDVEARFKFLIEQIERITGIKNFATYMNKLMTIDALALNEDRHLHNIAVILNTDGHYSLSPIYDQGAGLLADTTLNYPLSGDLYKMIDSVKSKTFSDSFDDQLDISERISHTQLHFAFTRNDVISWLSDSELVTLYTDAELSRVEKIVCDRMLKYQYLWG